MSADVKPPGLCFSVPYNDDPETLSELFRLKEHGANRITEVYLSGPQEFAGSGRLAAETSVKEFLAVVERIHGAGLRADLVLNSTCEGTEWYSRKSVDRLLGFIALAHEEHGVETVTLANPLYLSEIRKRFPGLEICASVLANIDCVQRAVIYREAGADVITPDADINRDLPLLKEIKDATGARIKLLANEGCLYKCPFRQFHFNAKSHASKEIGGDETDVSFADFFGAGTNVMDNDLSQLLKSPWIRPEDLRAYGGITDYFKLVCRSQKMSFVTRAARAYLEEAYEGDLLDLVSGCSKRFSMERGAYLDNASLGRRKFFETVTACGYRCAACGFCDELAGELIATSVYTPQKAADAEK
jgi:collagenase-like PrtC family protease